MPRSNLNTYALTFNGTGVAHLHRPSRFAWTSVYDEQHVVLTYPIVNGQPTHTPRIAATFKTADAAKRYLRETGSLNTYPGQSFIVHVLPGTTDLREASIVEHRPAARA